MAMGLSMSHRWIVLIVLGHQKRKPSIWKALGHYSFQVPMNHLFHMANPWTSGFGWPPPVNDTPNNGRYRGMNFTHGGHECHVVTREK